MISGRLILLARVGWLVRSNFSELGGEWPQMDYPDVPWWTEKEDKDLVRGIYKHGFGKYIPTSTDPELCFHDRVQTPRKEKKKKGKGGKKTTTTEDEIEDDEVQGGEMEEEEQDGGEVGDSHLVTPKEGQLLTWPGNKWLTLRFKQALKDLEVLRKAVMKKQAQQQRKQKKRRRKKNAN